MIRYLKHKEIDKTRWDRAISTSAHPLIYARAAWLDALCPDSWDAMVEDDYAMVFPLPRRKKMGYIYTYTPFFIQQLGFFSPVPPDEKKAILFLEAIPEEFRLAELKLNLAFPVPAKDWVFSANHNYELSLAPDYDRLKAGYHENHRRNIRKFSSSGCTLRRAGDAEAVITLFRQGKGKEVKHWRDAEYENFRRLLRTFDAEGAVRIMEVYDGPGTMIAGAVFLSWKGRHIFLFSATGRRAKELGAMPGLIDATIREYAGTGDLLDFEGSNDAGLARFYAGFGAGLSIYHAAVRNRLGTGINLLKRLVR